mmetsp:Transcript_19015/g.47601  ORF Transcript_19015/g.47601 Transcript_19015/m.47601 type:complete len:92 (-) Transcript_19015:164-439(-)
MTMTSKTLSVPPATGRDLAALQEEVQIEIEIVMRQQRTARKRGLTRKQSRLRVGGYASRLLMNLILRFAYLSVAGGLGLAFLGSSPSRMKS